MVSIKEFTKRVAALTLGLAAAAVTAAVFVPTMYVLTVYIAVDVIGAIIILCLLEEKTY